jgi:hypothetical protein
MLYDLIDVTSLNRPDEKWVFIDAAGHEHFWTFNGQRGRYSPEAKAETPTLVCIEDVPASDEYPAVSHYECKVCGEIVRPRTCPDQTRQYIRGLRRA